VGMGSNWPRCQDSFLLYDYPACCSSTMISPLSFGTEPAPTTGDHTSGHLVPVNIGDSLKNLASLI